MYSEAQIEPVMLDTYGMYTILYILIDNIFF